MPELGSLRSRASSGFIWSAVERFGQQGVLFLVQLVLARILAPEEFGLIAMVAVFVAISSAFVDCGFGRALIQKKEVSAEDLSTIFYFNCIAGALTASALWLLAPFLAAFYEDPRLQSILQFLSVGVFFGAISMVQASLLNRELKFKSLFYSSFPAITLSGIAGIIVALKGGGVWALVVQTLSEKLLRSVFLWFQVSWRPEWRFSWKSLKEMFPYGSRLALSSLLDQGFQNIYVLVIGKFFSPIDVGYFQRAKSFQQLPVGNFQSILSRVAFPLFATIQDDPARMRRGLHKALLLGTLFSFTAMAGMAALAEPMIVVLIGEKWLPAVPYLQWLCVVGALFPIHAINVNLLMAIGRADCFLRLEIYKKALILLNVCITFRFGIQMMIYGMIVTSAIALAINAYYTQRFINYGLISQLRDTLPAACIALFMYLIVTLFVYYVDVAEVFLLFGGIFLGVSVVAALLRFLNQAIKEELFSLCARLPFGERLASLLF